MSSTSAVRAFLHNLSLGVTVTQDGCYFAVWAPEATALVVHFFTPTDEELGSFSLPHYCAGIFSGFVPDLRPGTCYALEALGLENPRLGTFFRPRRLLVDPYAKALNRPFIYDHNLYTQDSVRFLPKAVVPEPDDAFDWQGVDKPQLHGQDLMIYELNVRSYTRLCTALPPELRGTYQGLCHPYVLEHLRALGVNAIQLLPVAASMTEPYLTGQGLHNLWGYNPVCFMVPDPRYAQNPLRVRDEFRTMVRELHRHGIAVILDVVYNHTAEAGPGGPVLSFKGLDNKRYYCFSPRQDYEHYLNVTGCGNSFNVNDAVGLKLVMDSLRYWTEVMQVDGFRFDLAVTCCRSAQRQRDEQDQPYPFDGHCAFLKACFAVDSLRSAVLIAEPWDLGEDGYQLGHFPALFYEQNDRFRDEVRRFWRGDPGQIGHLATRLMGSRDCFKNGLKPLKCSLNYITYHDGFTLEDLVSYADRHNEANLSDNQDGTAENFSSNCGEEGPSQDLKVQERRRQLKRNYLATLLLALGTPHFLAGDELGRTQRGNNNAFCQDNEISYLHWDLTLEQQDFLNYVQRLCALRRRLEIYKSPDTLNYHQGEQALFAQWYQPNGLPFSVREWEDPAQAALLLHLGLEQHRKESICILINNTEEQLYFVLPQEHYGLQWQVSLDTSTPNGQPSVLLSVATLAPHSLKVLELGREGQASL